MTAPSAAPAGFSARTRLLVVAPHPDDETIANGLLIQQVRATGRDEIRGIPAVALTAYARIEDRRRALMAGFQKHVPKPIDPSGLVKVIADLAGRP